LIVPSPFPGVDPYLEATGLWETFHTVLITGCMASLNRHLPEPYFAQVETRIELATFDQPESQHLPDVVVGRGDTESSHRPEAEVVRIGTLEPTTIPLAKRETEVRERWIEILHLPQMELITVIELLSPSNKMGPGRSEYIQKRNALIDLSVNLVEIDLLLSGKRMPMAKPLPQGDYLALVARTDRRPDQGFHPVYYPHLRRRRNFLITPVSGVTDCSEQRVFLEQKDTKATKSRARSRISNFLRFLGYLLFEIRDSVLDS
jgi:hypothetical protein